MVLASTAGSYLFDIFPKRLGAAHPARPMALALKPLPDFILPKPDVRLNANMWNRSCGGIVINGLFVDAGEYFDIRCIQERTAKPLDRG